MELDWLPTQRAAHSCCVKLEGWDSRSAGELGQYISGTVVSLIHRVPVLPAELVAVSDSPGFPPEFLRTGGNIPSVSAYTPYLPTSHVSFVLQYVLFPTSVHS